MLQIQLITLYCTICHRYDTKLWVIVQRLSNNCRPQFTDQEVITAFLWGIIQRQPDVKAIYTYIRSHWLEWFPALPGYQAFVRRLNALGPVLEALSSELAELLTQAGLPSTNYVVDSAPIMLAKGHYADHAKVAPQFCSKTYNASRKEWYYGMKLHMVGLLQPGTIPIPQLVRVTPAAMHDITALKQIIRDVPPTCGGCLYGDKAYRDDTWQQELWDQYHIQLKFPRMRPKRLVETIVSSDTVSTCMSRIRQPIESFFHWLQEKTRIQLASKVRSAQGLFIHVFGRLAAALIAVSLGF
jgi:hypothetical protein